MKKMNNIKVKALALGLLGLMGAITTVPSLGGVALTGVAAYVIWIGIGVAGINVVCAKSEQK